MASTIGAFPTSVSDDAQAHKDGPVTPVQQPTPPDSTGDGADRHHAPLLPTAPTTTAAGADVEGDGAAAGAPGQVETEEDDGSDRYTSASDSDDSDDETVEARLSEKAREKRQRLRKERDLLKPKYFFGEKEAREEAERKGGRARTRGPKGNRGVPVFMPTMDQFRDFYKYMEAIDHWGMRSGIVKIIPPKEWTGSLPHLGQESLREDGKGQMLKQARIKSPIEQHVQGSQGLYRVVNVTRNKIYNPLQWYDYVHSRGLAPPDFFSKPSEPNPEDQPEDGPSEVRATRSARAGAVRQLEKKKPPTRAGAKRRGVTKDIGSEAGTPIPENESAVGSPAMTRMQTEEPLAGAGSEEPLETPRKPSTEAGPPSGETPSSSTPATPATNVQSLATGTGGDAATVDTPATTVVDGQPLPSEAKRAKRKPAHLTNIPDDDEWAEFVKVYDKLPYEATKEDYSFDALKEIEAQYWRSVAIGKEPVYGADTKGSLFDERTTEWNVAHLDNLLTRLKLRQKIPGVNTPYLYFGAWRATFAWHVEDADLYSINYIHFGAPKFWYAIAQADNPRFERFMASQFGPEAKKCSQFLRHKAFLASPQLLANAGISLNRVAQMPGEIILTYPYGYHSGFNMGFNCAESVNFATEAWIDIGRKAKACACIDDSVSINVDAWLAEHAEAVAREEERLAKRKRPVGSSAAASAKRKRRESDLADGTGDVEGSKRQAAGQGSLVSVAGPPRKVAPSKPAFPCALCPDMSEDTLVRIVEENPGKITKRAHKICAMFTPSTWIQTLPDGEEVVMGFAAIEKARWALKCQLCSEKMGTKVQCTKSIKCVRACHVTCAARHGSGFVVDALIGHPPATHSILDPNAGPIPGHVDTNGPLQLVVLCRQHNPEWVKIEAERKAQELSDRICALPPGSVVNIRVSGSVFAVYLLEHRQQKRAILVQFGNGQFGEIAHSKVVFEKPEKGPKRSEDDPYIYEHVRNTGTRVRNAASSATPTPTPAPLPVAGPSNVVYQQQQPYAYPPSYPTQMAPYPTQMIAYPPSAGQPVQMAAYTPAPPTFPAYPHQAPSHYPAVQGASVPSVPHRPDQQAGFAPVVTDRH